MKNFKTILEETIKDNEEELKHPSQFYEEDTKSMMVGYNQALKDMLLDYKDYLEEESKEKLCTINLN